MTEIAGRTTYIPVRRNDYVVEARSQLQKLAIGGVIALVLGAAIGPPGLLKAGVALGVAGLVGLAVLATFEQ